MEIEDIQASLKDAIIADRVLGPPNGGAAIVTVTFATYDGGEEFFNLLERLIGG